MTDKVKIKAIIKQYADKGERLLKEAYEDGEHASTTGYWDGYGDCANLLLRELDDMQEEPISEKKCMYSKDNYTDEDRKILCEGCEEECEFNKKEEPINDSFETEVKKLWMEINTGHSYSIVDSYNIFYGLCMDIAEWQKEQQNIIEPIGEPQVKESFISKHEDKTCKENVDSLTQESVSEIDFEQELYKYFGQVKDFTLGMRIAKRFYEIGRNHQEPVSEDLEKEMNKMFPILGHTASTKLGFYDVARHFANWQKQKMMKDAVDATVHIDAGGYPYIPQIELYDYDKDIPLAKEGDKYKVVLIKED